VLVSEGSVLNVSTASQYNTSGPPFILDKVHEGTIYSFAVMLETGDGYRSQISEVSSVEMPVGKREVLHMFLLLKLMILY
jgi:hypothetical protein